MSGLLRQNRRSYVLGKSAALFEEDITLLGNLYPRARDAIEGVRDACETIRQDWPAIALGLIVRGNGLLFEEHAEVSEYRERETKQLRDEYLRRRWRNGKEHALSWYERELAQLHSEIVRRNTEIDQEQLRHILRRHGDDEDILVIVEDHPKEDGC